MGKPQTETKTESFTPNAVEQKFQRDGEGVERDAAMLATLGIMEPTEVRKNIEDAGYMAAEEMGIDKGHAKTIIDGILAQFDRDLAAA